MSHLVVLFLETRCDVVPGLVVTGGVTGVVVASGGAATGVVDAEDDDAPLDAEAVPVLGDEDALVVLVVAVVVAVVDVDLVEVVLLTLAALNGSRVRLVGVVRCPEAAWEWWVTGDDVVDVPVAAGGAAMSALA